MILYILLNIVSFFRILLVLILIYLAFKMIIRFIAPKLVENAANKIFQDMKNRDGSRGRQTVRKGDMTIDYSEKKPKQYKRGDGDYIEFEEVDDKK
jgi:hypothetical protein